MTKLLKDIAYKSGIEQVIGSTNVAIDNICFDSREANNFSLFIAVNGTQVDGHLFILKAIEQGALAIVCEQLPDQLKDNVTYLQVKNSQRALGFIASNCYNRPSENLKLVGITGTNGKTTVSSLLYQLFKFLGYKVGLISTIGNKIHNHDIVSTHTTPDPIQLNKLLSWMVDAGCTYCFMEVSSHAIEQHRIAGLEFTGGVFTNITHDHLDYHKTFDNYITAKKKFFDGLSSEAFSLVNNDDFHAEVMLQNTNSKQYTFAVRSLADFRCKVLENHFDGLVLSIDGSEVYTQLVGTFNAYNLLTVYAVAKLLKQNDLEILTDLSKLKPVEGRFSFVKSTNDIVAVVDYAHTPDALKNVLDTINDIRGGQGRLITVVGCGGDRDKDKRPLMAKIACKRSDKVVFTSDNPRTEDPQTILQEMEKGVESEDYVKTLAIENRKQAIKAAVGYAAPGDIILIAGKGHEKHQDINGVKHPFDDMQEIINLFEITT